MKRALAHIANRRPQRRQVDLRPLVARLDELEAMVEGLQDSVDRQARRHDERFTELAKRIEPGELARTLSDDARKRGL